MSLPSHASSPLLSIRWSQFLTLHPRTPKPQARGAPQRSHDRRQRCSWGRPASDVEPHAAVRRFVTDLLKTPDRYGAPLAGVAGRDDHASDLGGLTSSIPTPLVGGHDPVAGWSSDGGGDVINCRRLIERESGLRRIDTSRMIDLHDPGAVEIESIKPLVSSPVITATRGQHPRAQTHKQQTDSSSGPQHRNGKVEHVASNPFEYPLSPNASMPFSSIRPTSPYVNKSMKKRNELLRTLV